MDDWLYLCKYWLIVFQILISSSWDNFLQMQSLLSFILTKASWRIFAIKGGMSIFHILRVFSKGHDFFSKLDSTFPSFASNIYVVLASFTLNFEYVVAETIRYLKCAIYLSQFFVGSAHLYLFQTSITNLVLLLFSTPKHISVTENGKLNNLNSRSKLLISFQNVFTTGHVKNKWMNVCIYLFDQNCTSVYFLYQYSANINLEKFFDGGIWTEILVIWNLKLSEVALWNDFATVL